VQQLKAFFSNLDTEIGDARDIAARTTKASHEAKVDRIIAGRKNDWYGVAALAANAAVPPIAMIADGLRRTRSAASAGSRSKWPSVMWYSTVTSPPCEKPGPHQWQRV